MALSHTNREIPVISPTLYRLAADRRYGEVRERVVRHPSSAAADLSWTDRYGSTALHLLCQARTVDEALLRAVGACVTANPEAVQWTNAATWTPLHFAVEQQRLEQGHSLRRRRRRRRNDDPAENRVKLILRLIQACPAAVKVRTSAGHKKQLPFHIACRVGADIRVLEAMLRAYPAAATEPCIPQQPYAVAENPLQLLWNSERKGSLEFQKRALLEKKMALLLKAAHTGSVNRGSSPFCILHAACSVRVPRDYFETLLTGNPEVRPDRTGRWPLHYAVQTAVQAEGHATFTTSAAPYWHFVITSVLELDPHQASIPDPLDHDRLPLHVSLAPNDDDDDHDHDYSPSRRRPTRASLTWHEGGVKELCLAYANALGAVDPVTGLLPFQAAAVNAEKSRALLSTCYELLRAAPEMIRKEELSSAKHTH